MKHLSLTLFLMLLAFAYGITVGHFHVFPFKWLQQAKISWHLSQLESEGYHGKQNRTVIDCKTLASDHTLVLLILGQSNAANHGEHLYTPRQNVYNFFAGACFVAQDPLLGTSGDQGSVWLPFADLVLQQTPYQRVLLVPLAIAGSAVHQWRPDGKFFPRIATTQQALAAQGLKVTQVIWHQGETDTALETSRTAYQTDLSAMIQGLRGLKITAPVFISIASWLKDTASPAVREAQQAVIAVQNGVFMGPDTDQLLMRRDGTHFSQRGQQAFAEAAYQAMFAVELDN